MAVDLTSICAGAAAAGVSACFVALIGVDPTTLGWSFLGAAAGLTLPEKTGRVQAVAAFFASVFGGALLATWTAAHYFDGASTPRYGIAMVSAVAVHPALVFFRAQLPALLPDVLRGLVRRIAPKDDNGGRP